MAKLVVGPRAKVSMKYANGTILKLYLDRDWGPLIRFITVEISHVPVGH